MGAAAGRIRLAVPKDVVLSLGASLGRDGRHGAGPADHQGDHRRCRSSGTTPLHRPGRPPSIVAAVVVYVLTYVRRYYGGRLALDVQHDLRTEMYDTITRLDGRRQDELSTGQVVGRATSDLQLIQGLLFMLPMTIGNVLLFLVSLVDHGGAVAAAHPGRARRRPRPVVHRHAQPRPALPRHLVRPGAGRRRRRGRGRGRHRRPGGQGLRAGGAGDRQAAARSAGRLFAGRLRTVRLNARYTPALQAVPALGQVAMLALGGWLATRGQITLGTFVAFSTYLAQLVGPVRMLAMVLTVGQQARAGVERVFELIDTEPTIEERHARSCPPTPPPPSSSTTCPSATTPSRPVLDGFACAIAARRDRRRRRLLRLAASRPSRCCCPASTT